MCDCVMTVLSGGCYPRPGARWRGLARQGGEAAGAAAGGGAPRHAGVGAGRGCLALQPPRRGRHSQRGALPLPHLPVPVPGHRPGSSHWWRARHVTARLYPPQKLSSTSTLQLFRKGPAAQARKQFLNSSAGRWLDATFTRRAWAAGVIALLSLEPEDNRLTKILFEFFES